MTHFNATSLLSRCFYTATLALLLVGSLAAQNAQPSSTSTVNFGLGYLRTDFDALSDPLARAGYPTLASEGIRFEFGTSTRYQGRLQTGYTFSFDHYFTSGAQTVESAFQTRSTSTDYGGFGVRGGVGYDLLYPSAWNLMVGLNLESFFAQLKTTEQIYGGPNGPFDGSTNENKYQVGAISAIPQLTLESIEFGDRARVYLGVGYRVSGDTHVLRNDGNELAGVGEISHDGLVVSFGVKRALGRRGSESTN